MSLLTRKIDAISLTTTAAAAGGGGPLTSLAAVESLTFFYMIYFTKFYMMIELLT